MVPSRKRMLAATAAVAIAALVVAGCGSSNKSGTTSPTTGGATSAPAASGSETGTGTGSSAPGDSMVVDGNYSLALSGSNTNPHPVSDLAQGGNFRWAINSMPPNFNYNELDGTLADNAYVINAVMPQLFLGNPDGTLKMNTDYLVSAEMTKADPTTVVYKINPKAVWYDGTTTTPMSAADFIAQWKSNNGKDTRFKQSSTNGYENVASVVQGATPQDVTVTYDGVYADWQGIFSPLYPAATNSDPNAFNTGWINKMPVTGGPFMLDKIDKTANTITLKHNPEWWGDKPVLDTITYLAIEDATAQTQGVINGEIDHADMGPIAANLQLAKAASNVDIRAAQGPDFRHMDFGGGGIFGDLNVRKAFAMSIDRGVIAKALLGPLGVPDSASIALGNHILMTNQAGYKDNSAPYDKVDIAGAQKLLESSGWTKSGNSFTKDGKKLSCDLVIPSGTPNAVQESGLIQQMASKAGFEVNIKTVPTQDFFNAYVTPGKFDITLFTWLGTPFPISSAKSIYYQVDPENPNQNYGRLGSDAIDKAFDDGLKATDEAGKEAAANAIDQAIWDNVQTLTTYQRPQLWVEGKKVANMGGLAFQANSGPDYTKIGFLK